MRGSEKTFECGHSRQFICLIALIVTKWNLMDLGRDHSYLMLHDLNSKKRDLKSQLSFPVKHYIYISQHYMYISFCLHSSLHLTVPSFIHETPSYTQLPSYLQNPSLSSMLHTLSFPKKKKNPVVMHPYFLQPLCLYSLIHPHLILQCFFCIDCLHPR